MVSLVHGSSGNAVPIMPKDISMYLVSWREECVVT